MNTDIKRCTRCILPENYPGIRFDNDGMCNVCLDYDRKWSSWKNGGSKETHEQLDKDSQRRKENEPKI